MTWACVRFALYIATAAVAVSAGSIVFVLHQIGHSPIIIAGLMP